MVPAPPPKENAWSRPRSDAGSHPAEPARQVSEGWPTHSGFGDFNSGVRHVVKSMTAGSNPKVGLLTGALLNILARDSKVPIKAMPAASDKGCCMSVNGGIVKHCFHPFQVCVGFPFFELCVN